MDRMSKKRVSLMKADTAEAEFAAGSVRIGTVLTNRPGDRDRLLIGAGNPSRVTATVDPADRPKVLTYISKASERVSEVAVRVLATGRQMAGEASEALARTARPPIAWGDTSNPGDRRHPRGVLGDVPADGVDALLFMALMRRPAPYCLGLFFHRASAAFRARTARCAGLSPFHRT